MKKYISLSFFDIGSESERLFGVIFASWLQFGDLWVVTVIFFLRLHLGCDKNLIYLTEDGSIAPERACATSLLLRIRNFMICNYEWNRKLFSWFLDQRNHLALPISIHTYLVKTINNEYTCRVHCVILFYLHIGAYVLFLFNNIIGLY